MTKKLQIFISSTYKDLLAERQAAVEAILTAGHIPAGMELFTAGDESQLETIYRWIEESDIFMLILGGRYGTVEEKSGKSYTHLEYEHAIKTGKATFAVVMNEDALAQKVKNSGAEVLELKSRKEYDAFKTEVLAKMCLFFSDHKDIQLALHRTLARFLREREFAGWVSGANQIDMSAQTAELTRLSAENADLRAKLAVTEKKLGQAQQVGNISFDTLRGALEKLVLPRHDTKPPYVPSNLLQLFFLFRHRLSLGVINDPGARERDAGIGMIIPTPKLHPQDSFVFYDVAVPLIQFELVTREKLGNTGYQRIKTSSLGNRFLTYLAVSGYDPALSEEAVLVSPVILQHEARTKKPAEKP